MKGVFVNWTKPYIERKRLRGYAFKVYREQESDEYMTTDEEILFTILSVGYWKKFNGKTKLYTDKPGLYYYLKNNMISLWDEVDTQTLENYTDVDAGQFWTSGKSYCIGVEKGPFCFMDLDFIIKEKLPEWVFNSEVTIHYWEIPRGYYYPNKEQFQNFVIANLFENSEAWAGTLLQPEAEVNYLLRQKVVQSLSYTFENDCKVIFENCKDPNELLSTNGDHPRLLTMALRKEISPETLIVLNAILQFLPMGDRKITDTIRWPDYRRKLTKYASFLTFDTVKYKLLLKKIIL
jgi:hypothetical protein